MNGLTNVNTAAVTNSAASRPQTIHSTAARTLPGRMVGPSPTRRPSLPRRRQLVAGRLLVVADEQMPPRQSGIVPRLALERLDAPERVEAGRVGRDQRDLARLG